jgi:hypothetical protein
MNIGFAGLPMSGKTTVFNMATRSKAETRDYLSQTDQVNTGIIKVPDARIEALTEIFKPKKTVYATVEFIDIPGVTKSEGGSDSGLAGKTLAHVRGCDAIGLVVRLFGGTDVPHVYNRIDPRADMEELLLEFVFADLQVIQNKIERSRKELKAGKKPEVVKELELMERLTKCLEENRLISELDLSPEEMALTRNYRFLTQKPIIAIGNCSEEQLKDRTQKAVTEFQAMCTEKRWLGLLLAARTEMEIADLSPEEEMMFLQEYGITESGRSRLIQEAYRILNYISFLTVGEDEVRAWPIQQGTVAQKAAGKVHSDIERGFIRAEVVAYDVFREKGSLPAVKQAGAFRLEGKEYVVKDGDIINFRFNV